MSKPPLQLSRLRAIGWSNWDPIGLLGPGASWANEPFADEYDSYLLEAASGLRNGWSAEQATDFLVSVAEEHMGRTTASRAAADATIKAIESYLQQLDGG